MNTALRIGLVAALIACGKSVEGEHVTPTELARRAGEACSSTYPDFGVHPIPVWRHHGDRGMYLYCADENGWFLPAVMLCQSGTIWFEDGSDEHDRKMCTGVQ